MLSYVLCATLINPAATGVGAEITAVDPQVESPVVNPWWKGPMHLGIQLHYGVGSASMEAANSGLHSALPGNQASTPEPFGLAHSVEVSLVYVSPWHVRLQAGAAGLYDWGSFDATATLVDATGAVVGTQNVEVTGHAWAVVVPILLGYRLPLLDGKLAPSIDIGVEIQPAGGYGFTSELQDSPGIKTAGTSVGWTLRAGVAWHPVPQFAVTLEFTGRGLTTDELVLEDYPAQKVYDANHNPVKLDFSGVGVRTGITGYFF